MCLLAGQFILGNPEQMSNLGESEEFLHGMGA